MGEPGSGDETEHFLVEKATEITVFLVLGVAFVALGLGYDWFWLVFLIGFAVVLPLVGVVGELLVELGADDATDEVDPLDSLKDRYARGEIDEEEFERRLELLVDADSPAEVRRRLERGDGSGAVDGARRRDEHAGRDRAAGTDRERDDERDRNRGAAGADRDAPPEPDRDVGLES